MHTGHAGVLRQALQWVFGLDLSKLSQQLTHKFSQEQIAGIDAALRSWKYCVPDEFNRKPRTMASLNKWKMRETYVVGTRIIPALLAVEEHVHRRSGRRVDISVRGMSKLQQKYFFNYMNLVVALRIVSSNSMRPIPRVSRIATEFTTHQRPFCCQAETSWSQARSPSTITHIE